MVPDKQKSHLYNKKTRVGVASFSACYVNITPGPTNLWALCRSDMTSSSLSIKPCVQARSPHLISKICIVFLNNSEVVKAIHILLGFSALSVLAGVLAVLKS